MISRIHFSYSAYFARPLIPNKLNKHFCRIFSKISGFQTEAVPVRINISAKILIKRLLEIINFFPIAIQMLLYLYLLGCTTWNGKIYTPQFYITIIGCDSSFINSKSTQFVFKARVVLPRKETVYCSSASFTCYKGGSVHITTSGYYVLIRRIYG